MLSGLVLAAAATAAATQAAAPAQPGPVVATPAPASAPVPPISGPAPAASALPSGEGGSFGFVTAGRLAEKCQDGSPTSLSYCFAYITGIHDTIRAYEVWLSQREFCVPASTSQAELRRAFLGYLAAYPDRKAGQAASVVVVALKESYPCAPAGQ